MQDDDVAIYKSDFDTGLLMRFTFPKCSDHVRHHIENKVFMDAFQKCVAILKDKDKIDAEYERYFARQDQAQRKDSV